MALINDYRLCVARWLINICNVPKKKLTFDIPGYIFVHTSSIDKKISNLNPGGITL